MTTLPPAHESDADGDDEALSWDGESDSSHVAGPKPPREARAKPARVAKPGRASAVVAEPADPDAPAEPADSEPQPTSSVLLVAYGIVAGVYALYTVGWATTILRGSGTMATLLGEIMFQFGEFLAIAAAPLWFASVLFLTRGRRPALRLLWLLVGLLLLVPVPFVMGV